MPNNTCLVFDLDSTLADNSVRAEMLNRVCSACLGSYGNTTIPRRGSAYCPTCAKHTRSKILQSGWDSFMDPKNFALDTPTPGAAEFVGHVRKLDFIIVFLTGRHERSREDTEKWLVQHMGKEPTEPLIMRDEDNVPASRMKDKIFLQYRADVVSSSDMPEPGYIFFEDDPHVFPMWMRYGIVLKCPEAFTLGILNPDGDKMPEPVVKL